ncbi:MAG: GTPase [Candidatus Gracilibacteria bacterium]|jgi:guanylate kinase|nr:GTPase [Candidatus Gracilibacteria bacterium]
MQNENILIGKLFLIVGPSGSGKSSVLKAIKKRYRGFVYPVSFTTRPIRDGEVEGEVYNFISVDDFKRKIDAGDFLEYAVVHGTNYYGTDKKTIIDALSGGAVVVREVDVQGFLSIKSIVPKENLVSIFIDLGDEKELEERIRARGVMNEDEFLRRMESMNKEMKIKDDCDFVVKNPFGKLNECISDVEQIILDEIKNLY